VNWSQNATSKYDNDMGIRKKRSGRKKKWPPLSDQQLELCPYGDKTCSVCQLPPQDIKILHRLKNEDKYSYRKLREYIVRNYTIRPDFTVLTKHFKEHLGENIAKTLEKVVKKEKHTEIIEALHPMDADIIEHTNKDIENAYGQLVKMAASYTKDIEKLQREITKLLKTKNIAGELKGLSAIELLERLAKLNKEARDQVRDVSALRAPKIMVAQVIESFINEIIGEVSTVLTNLCGELQHEILEELKANYAEDKISNDTFANLFMKTALDYRDRMISLKRQQMAAASAALSEMEKII